MRLTTKELRKIISEEVSNLLAEADPQLSLFPDLQDLPDLDKPVMPPVQEPKEPDEVEKLMGAFRDLLNKIDSRSTPILRKVDTVNELAKMLGIMIDLVTNKTNGGLTDQETITALTKLRRDRAENSSS